MRPEPNKNTNSRGSARSLNNNTLGEKRDTTLISGFWWGGEVERTDQIRSGRQEQTKRGTEIFHNIVE